MSIMIDPRWRRQRNDDDLTTIGFVLLVCYVVVLLGLFFAIVAVTTAPKSHGAAPTTWSEDQLPECCTEDLLRFPDLTCAEQNLERSRKHREWLETTAQLYPWNWTGAELCALRLEADNNLWMWERLESLRRAEIDGWVSSHTLNCMREQLGPRAYYRGEMPPSVPPWRRFGD